MLVKKGKILIIEKKITFFRKNFFIKTNKEGGERKDFI